jgi:uncharacterized protein with HEPN domain
MKATCACAICWTTPIHGYDSVDFDILWQIVSDDLPPLIAALEEALKA